MCRYNASIQCFDTYDFMHLFEGFFATQLHVLFILFILSWSSESVHSEFVFVGVVAGAEVLEDGGDFFPKKIPTPEILVSKESQLNVSSVLQPRAV